LLDADVYGPSIPMMMNLKGEPYLNNRKSSLPDVTFEGNIEKLSHKKGGH